MGGSAVLAAGDVEWGRAAEGIVPGGDRSRRVVLAMTDALLRQTIAAELRTLRWEVREAQGGAELLALLEQETATAAILDPWFPDLDVQECVGVLLRFWPDLELLASDGSVLGGRPTRGFHRAELLHGLRQAVSRVDQSGPEEGEAPDAAPPLERRKGTADGVRSSSVTESPAAAVVSPLPTFSVDLPEFVGSHPAVAEVCRRVRLVARRHTPVLVHGASGTGKELVARALHRLSGRGEKPLVVINCAAIPEALVEAELFGHTRGAFTGAQGSRVGRIEAAAGGTLFLDEIGELPLPAQSKLLRFLESGEIQRVGENETIHVDTRVVAATHRRLGAMASDGSFRLDLLHRLSVFVIQTPALAGRPEDLDALIEHTLRQLAVEDQPKVLSQEAREKLHNHPWPGNVRELEHTLERGWILAGDSAVIDEACIEFNEGLY